MPAAGKRRAINVIWTYNKPVELMREKGHPLATEGYLGQLAAVCNVWNIARAPLAPRQQRSDRIQDIIVIVESDVYQLIARDISQSSGQNFSLHVHLRAKAHCFPLFGIGTGVLSGDS